MSRPLDPDEFVRGLDPSLRLADATRIVPSVAAKLPVDTVGAGRVPAGVHLAMVGDASSVILTVRPGEATSAPAPTVADVFTAWSGDRVVARVPAAQEVVIDLPPRSAHDVVSIYLPEPSGGVVVSMVALGGDLRPAPVGRRWVAYGDSITQGWSVSDVGLAWPSLVARRMGLDLVNLAFAGSARGELPAAVQVSGSGADLVTLSFGTNCWSSIPTDERHIAETMRLFLAVVREGLPDVPVVVVSPIVRPAAESTPNRFGATLHDLRVALEKAVTVSAQTDGRLVLVPGRDLVDAADLVDGVHPGDAGQAAMARTLAGVIDSTLADGHHNQ
jgi:lysophospholipase L1-like esterase